jgi:hypothetical protein
MLPPRLERMEWVLQVADEVDDAIGALRHTWLGLAAEFSSPLAFSTRLAATLLLAAAMPFIGADKKGKEFDSSARSGQPFRFVIGGGQVIKGWDQGVAGMKVGGRRRLIIPADLAYGAAGAGGVIPPGATLVFEVTLTGIE